MCPPDCPQTGREEGAADPGSNLELDHMQLCGEITQVMAPGVHLARSNRVRVMSLHIQPHLETAKAWVMEQKERKPPIGIWIHNYKTITQTVG